MYKPTYGIELCKLKSSPIRLAIQGAPHTGKTWAVVKTFPNVVVCDLDNKLGALRDTPGVTVLPFWDDAFINETTGPLQKDWNPGLRVPHKRGQVSKRHDVLYQFLKLEGPKFSPDQTLFIDSATMIETELSLYWQAWPIMTKPDKEGKTEENYLKVWDQRRLFWRGLIGLLKTMPCTIVMSFHEFAEQDKDGRPTGRSNPLLQGSFKDEVGGHFTDWFRQIVKRELGTDGKPKPGTQAEYLWQVLPDGMSICGTTRPSLLAKGQPQVKADYASLL